MRADERHWHLWKIEDSVRADRLPKPLKSAKAAGKARKRGESSGGSGARRVHPNLHRSVHLHRLGPV